MIYCMACKGEIPATHFYVWHPDGKTLYAKCNKHFQNTLKIHIGLDNYRMIELSPEEVVCFEVIGS